jgi:SNF2 family DNA or RNA helicase
LTFCRLLVSTSPAPSFKNRFQRPIEAARNKDATKFQIEQGKLAAKELQDLLKPYLLQRLKVDFLAEKLPAKKDFVVWTHLSLKQRSLYSAYVEAKDGAVMETILGLKSSPLIALSWLKKLIGHPILVSDGEKQSPISSIAPCDLLRDSVKLQIAADLVEHFSKGGHKTLVFSQSTKSLDIIQRVLKGKARGIGRVDGKVTGKHRQEAVDRFNEDGSLIDVMLISTGAGGVGLTLNAADRVILYDPAWNPASDSQAVDRCYRIGQTKDVFVYRLIAAGTVEEKVTSIKVKAPFSVPNAFAHSLVPHC